MVLTVSDLLESRNLERMESMFEEKICSFKFDPIKLAQRSGLEYIPEADMLTLNVSDYMYLTPEVIEQLRQQYSITDFDSHLEDLHSIQDNAMYAIAEELRSMAQLQIQYYLNSFGISSKDLSFIYYDLDSEAPRIAQEFVDHFAWDLKVQSSKFMPEVAQWLERGGLVEVVNQYFNRFTGMIYAYFIPTGINEFIHAVDLIKNSIRDRIETKIIEYLEKLAKSKETHGYEKVRGPIYESLTTWEVDEVVVRAKETNKFTDTSIQTKYTQLKKEFISMSRNVCCIEVWMTGVNWLLDKLSELRDFEEVRRAINEAFETLREEGLV
jgi:hypothetical protein